MSQMPSVDVTDLIGLPYQFGGVNPVTGVDCRWTTREGLERIFPDFDGDEFPLSADEEEVMLTRIRAGETRWIKVGESAAAAKKLGDVLHGHGPEGGSYVAVVVDQATPLAITADREHKVHLRKLRTLPGIVAVFRRVSR